MKRFLKPIKHPHRLRRHSAYYTYQAYLNNRDNKAEVVDARAEPITEKNIKTKIISADAAGISIPTFSLKNAHKITQMIKEIDENIFIVGGDPTVFSTLKKH